MSEKIEITCEESMDISVVSAIHEKLLSDFKEGVAISINASHVERIDAAALQLFSVLFNDASAKGITMEWVEPSEPVLSSAKLLGLTSLLCLE